MGRSTIYLCTYIVPPMEGFFRCVPRDRKNALFINHAVTMNSVSIKRVTNVCRFQQHHHSMQDSVFPYVRTKYLTDVINTCMFVVRPSVYTQCSAVLYVHRNYSLPPSFLLS